MTDPSTSLPTATVVSPPPPPPSSGRRRWPWSILAIAGLGLGNYGGLILATRKLILPRGLPSVVLGDAAVLVGLGVIAAGLVLAILGIRRAMRGLDELWAPPAWVPAPIAALLRFAYWVSVYQWRAIDADTPPPAPGQERRLFDPVVLVILITVAVSLTLQEYIGDRGTFNRWFSTGGADSYHELKSFAWWSGWRVFGYLVLPMLVIAALPGQRLRDYHISPRGFLRHLPTYVVLFLLILPAVIAASGTKAFQHTYPFYKYANRSFDDLVAWEALYAAQFLALEFFFRGLMLQGLRARLGANAIFVMIVPYCMIHYGKPMAETMGAIGAGVILGTLAMRTRSIWGGVVIHVAVAVTMDILALRACPPSGRPCGY